MNLTATGYLAHRLATPWKHEITAPQAAALTLLVTGVAQWNAPGGSSSNYVARFR
jgi:hypothetical protein